MNYSDVNTDYMSSFMDFGVSSQLPPFHNEDGLQASTSLGAWPGQLGPTSDFPMASIFEPFNQGSFIDQLQDTDLVDFVAPAQTQSIPLTQQELSSSVGVSDDTLAEPSTQAPLAPRLFRLDSGPSTDGTDNGHDALDSSDTIDCIPETGTAQTWRKTPVRCGNEHRASPQDEKSGPRLRRRRKKSRSPSSSEGDDSSGDRAKHKHSVVERRYRDNLNGKITQLRHTLQAIEASPRRGGSLSHETDPARRVRKCEIMTRAIQYVHVSELEMRHMTDEIKHLRERVQGLEKLVKCDDCVLLKNLRDLNVRQPS
ncbi:hypothetical protein EDD36DRAFT_227131 [Exophiala viscosa]|uniref:BHLH domain-containing protein n=1 Tax=Exophiala viscosa TaxID=2486360 RepID=A0AAN6IEH1_9EURO|nr:hypothetical protein EDD36DRAFT_227131 [Exophiala viscosa]